MALKELNQCLAWRPISMHGCALCCRQYAALLHQANLLFLLGRGLLFDRAADDPLLQVCDGRLCSTDDGPEQP